MENIVNDSEESLADNNDSLGPDSKSHGVEEGSIDTEEESGNPVEAYSPVNEANEPPPAISPPATSPPATSPPVEEVIESDEIVTRKRSLEIVSDDEELISEKRPRVENEAPQPNNNNDIVDDDDDGGISNSPFGEDCQDFTNMVDEIDEDDDGEQEEVGLEQEGDELEEVEEQGSIAPVEETNVLGDPEVEDEANRGEDEPTDFDIMMQRRKDAMSRARKRRQKDIDINSVDDQIHAMLQQMKYAAEEDCRLNLKKKPAIKKLTMLPTVMAQLKKIDLLTAFIESGMCSALADWLKPLPDHSLPHLKIREDILDVLLNFPEMDSHVLKTSGLGKAVMLIYRHPKEIRKNRAKAGKLINGWARPIFGLPSDYKALNRDEREERDWARLTQSAKRRLSSAGGSSQTTNTDEPLDGSLKPGDKGWIPRARVPMPSHKDYVVRPKWNVDRELKKISSSKKTLNRYEKHLQKNREKQTKNKNTHAISISIEGRKMPL